jgi:hypothetical protein
VVWLKSGDKNSKFFHKFAEHRRKINIIWDIQNMEGNLQSSQDDIGEKYYNYFKNLYKGKEKEDTLKQIRVIKEIPRFFSDKECNVLGRQVSIWEVEKM